MYLPSAFREDALDVQHDFIRAHPLGVVMTAGPGGLMANHIPCLLYPEGERGVLRLHMARANPHWPSWPRAPNAWWLFMVRRPMSRRPGTPPRQRRTVVPTWNFVAVHAWGKPVIQDDPAWLRAQLEAPDREPGEGPRPALARGGRAGRFHRRADARHRGRRDSHRAYRRQVESQPEPHPCRSAGRGARPGGRGATRSWRDWWRGAADWAETSHPRVASAGLRPFRATVTRSVARRCARRRARPGPRPGCLSRPPAAAAAAAKRNGCCPACSAARAGRTAPGEGIGGLRERGDQGHDAQRILA